MHPKLTHLATATITAVLALTLAATTVTAQAADTEKRGIM